MRMPSEVLNIVNRGIFNMIEIAEKYVTISGEAPIIGVPVYLIRLSSCNLDCIYCDTKFNRTVNYTYSVNQLTREIQSKVKEFQGLKVLITGGEPLIGERQNKLKSLFMNLNNIEFYVETNGSVVLDNDLLDNVHFVADWKSPSSGFEDSFAEENLFKLRDSNDCIKFVINKNDLGWLNDRIKEIRAVRKDLPLYISGQWGAISNEAIAEFIINNKINANMSIQLHKIIWGPDRRGV